MAWPTKVRELFWRGLLDDARAAYASVARAIAAFEPVLMVAHRGDGADAQKRCGPAIDVIEFPIDDSWIRDNGPILIHDTDGQRVALHFGFNAWGGKLPPWDADAAVALPLCEHLGLRVEDVPLVLEGGSIAVNGHGLLITTRTCLSNPNRNPGKSIGEIEAVLKSTLGACTVLWLDSGIYEDSQPGIGTDGHVDNVVAFFDPMAVLLQSTSDSRNPNFPAATSNRALLAAAGLRIVDIDVLPYAVVNGRTVPVPYVNFYVANEGVVVPVTGAASDEIVLARIQSCFPGRRVVGVDGRVIAFGGGGVHCITQQVPTLRPGH